jgi:hypothetical protein
VCFLCTHCTHVVKTVFFRETGELRKKRLFRTSGRVIEVVKKTDPQTGKDRDLSKAEIVINNDEKGAPRENLRPTFFVYKMKTTNVRTIVIKRKIRQNGWMCCSKM